MSELNETRPTPKSRPRAAIDSGMDPADLTPAPSVLKVTPTMQAPTPSFDTLSPSESTTAMWSALMMQGSGETQQLGQRIAMSQYRLLSDVSQVTGIRIRTLLEFAIQQTYGTEEGRKLWQDK